MDKVYILLALSALTFSVFGQNGQDEQENQDRSLGPTIPIGNILASDCEPGLFVADELNMCWYWICLRKDDGSYELMPSKCSLGTRLPFSYRISNSNPCSVLFTGLIGYECSREAAAQNSEPPCAENLQCQNGGELIISMNLGTCWCVCPKEWQGDYDCSKATVENQVTQSPSEICPDGTPEDDWCARAGGCLNGGVCKNNCLDFWCDCPSPFRYGKRCERFQCKEGECFNGGTCRRGTTGTNEFRRCECTPEFVGYRCETPVGDIPFEPDVVDGRSIGK